MSNVISTLLKQYKVPSMTSGIVIALMPLIFRYPQHIAPLYKSLLLTEEVQMQIVATLLLLLFGLTTWCISLFLSIKRHEQVKPPSPNDFTWIPDPGYFVKDEINYCGKCLIIGTAANLSVYKKDGLKCRVCGEVYILPTSYSASFYEGS